MPQPSDIPPSQHCLARALYDNIPDSPDELAFQKGDTLTVLEQNTANIEGWWLCSLRGRQAHPSAKNPDIFKAIDGRWYIKLLRRTVHDLYIINTFRDAMLPLLQKS